MDSDENASLDPEKREIEEKRQHVDSESLPTETSPLMDSSQRSEDDEIRVDVDNVDAIHGVIMDDDRTEGYQHGEDFNIQNGEYEEEFEPDKNFEDSLPISSFSGLIQPDMGYPYFLAPTKEDKYACFQAIFFTFSTKGYWFLLQTVICTLFSISTISYLLDGIRCYYEWRAPGLVIFNFLVMPFYYLSFHINFTGGYWPIINFIVLVFNLMILESANILHAISFRTDTMMLIVYIFYGMTSLIHFSFLILIQLQNARSGIRSKNKGPPDETPRFRYRIHFMEENIFAFLLGLVGYSPTVALIITLYIQGKALYATDAFVHWIYVVYFLKFFVRRDFGYISTFLFGIYIISTINSYISAVVNIAENSMSVIHTWTAVSTMCSVLMNYLVIWSLILQNMFNNYKRIVGQNRHFLLLEGKIPPRRGDPELTDDDMRLFRAMKERNPELIRKDYTLDSVVLFRPILPEQGVGFERMLSVKDIFDHDRRKKLDPELILSYLESPEFKKDV